MKKTHLIYYLLLFLIFFNSCKSFFVQTQVPIEDIDAVSIFHIINEKSIDYDNISMRVSIEIIAGENSESFRGNIRIAKDSIIWMSFRSLNIEGARIAISPDSLKFINRINNLYYKGNLEFIRDRYGVELDYYSLQSILSNSFFFYPASNTKYDLRTCEDTSMYCIRTVAQTKYRVSYIDSLRAKSGVDINENPLETSSDIINGFISKQVKVYPEIYKPAEIYILNNVLQQNLIIKYENMFETDDTYFPKNISIDMHSPQASLEFALSIDNISFNRSNLNFPFSIPDRYEKIIME